MCGFGEYDCTLFSGGEGYCQTCGYSRSFKHKYHKNLYNFDRHRTPPPCRKYAFDFIKNRPKKHRPKAVKLHNRHYVVFVLALMVVVYYVVKKRAQKPGIFLNLKKHLEKAFPS